MPPTLDIVGIGVCTVDHLVTVPRMPHQNENMTALNYDRQPGGLASIALIAAARLGARAKIIARIGDDDAGAYIGRVLRDEGIDVAQLLVERGSESHMSVILVHEASGDRSIITRPPTGKPISPSEFSRADITAARVLFIDTLNEATLQAARWAKEADMKVLLDPGLPYAQIKPLLAYVDVPIVPEYWARELMPDQLAGMLVAERLRMTRAPKSRSLPWASGARSWPGMGARKPYPLSRWMWSIPRAPAMPITALSSTPCCKVGMCREWRVLLPPSAR